MWTPVSALLISLPWTLGTLPDDPGHVNYDGYSGKVPYLVIITSTQLIVEFKSRIVGKEGNYWKNYEKIGRNRKK